MPILGWRVHFTRRELPVPRSARPLLASLRLADVPAWLDAEWIEDGAPCLIGPDGTYDVELNSFSVRTRGRRTPRPRSRTTWRTS